MKVEPLVYVLLALMVCVSLVLFWWFNSRAERRARQLLRAVLTQDQYRQLIQRGYLDIKSPSHPQRFYRVPKAPGIVHVIENGSLQANLCLQPLDWVPEADFVVIHKLMIEADEETYLKKANRIVPIGTTAFNDGDLVELGRFFMMYHH
jgi:hypothetical protein